MCGSAVTGLYRHRHAHELPRGVSAGHLLLAPQPSSWPAPPCQAPCARAAPGEGLLALNHRRSQHQELGLGLVLLPLQASLPAASSSLRSSAPLCPQAVPVALPAPFLQSPVARDESMLRLQSTPGRMLSVKPDHNSRFQLGFDHTMKGPLRFSRTVSL